MYAEIKFGEKTVPMKTNAATPFRFQSIFKRDVLAMFSGKNTDGEEEAVAQLGFVMAMQAEGKDMTKLTQNDFLAWLEQYSVEEVWGATEDIFHFFNTGKLPNVEEKKRDDQQNEQ